MSPGLEIGACSHVGHVRRFNEDAYVATRSLVAVADGMGGHSGGDVASRIVVDELDRLPGVAPVGGARAALTGALARAHARVREHGERHPEQWGAGTTTVVAWLVPGLVIGVDGPGWLVGNVGDSRAYVWGSGGLVQVTRDHSVVAALLEAGMITHAEADDHPERHVLLRAVSANDAGAPEFFEVPQAASVRLLLCSDGVHGLLSDEVLAEVLSGGAPQACAEALVSAALAAGGTDNATAVVVDVV